ncbi:unnamed protein product [Psylliodes chrysocephalus]|uniref:Uncharacterized protein n=1 Tax=Psylliodes chrysocephalus TaxID=3402493 RepID=A0A9P0CTQ0_9CUCU|nr:unnamed protein product [Psylliodes chrysocephala]
MSWDMRKVYVSSLVKTTTSRRPKEDNSSRLLTFEYYLKKDTENIRICKKLFLNTLDLKEWMVKIWLNPAANNKIKDSNDIAMPSRSRLPVELKNGLEVLNTFLDKLIKLESHYCRPSTQRLYLEPLFQTKSNAYRDDINAKALSLIHFKKQMKINNIFVYKPKKDQCDVCIGYKTKNVSQRNYETHIKRKDEARKEKEGDKKIAMKMENRVIAVLTMDLQSVKLAPVLQASAIYYKTKLCIHNFTTFSLEKALNRSIPASEILPLPQIKEKPNRSKSRSQKSEILSSTPFKDELEELDDIRKGKEEKKLKQQREN